MKGRIFDDGAGDCCVLNGLGFGVGNFIGKENFANFAFMRYFCKARAAVTCSSSSFCAFSDDELSNCCTTESQKGEKYRTQ